MVAGQERPRGETPRVSGILKRLERPRDQALVDAEIKGLKVVGLGVGIPMVFFGLLTCAMYLYFIFDLFEVWGSSDPSDIFIECIMFFVTFLFLIFALLGGLLIYAPFGRVPLAVFEEGIFVGFISPKRISSRVIPVIPWELIETVRVEEISDKRGKHNIIIAEVRRFRKKNKKIQIFLIPGVRDAVKIMMKHIPDKVDKEVLELVKDQPWLKDLMKK